MILEPRQKRGPLSGIRVIDFGHYVAGPGAAMMLADQGAHVTRVEMPDGPAIKTAASAVLNRGKNTIRLNLKNDADLQTALELALHADVVVENFRPGVMARLGLGYENLQATNPGLVYLSLPGFSGDDPDFAGIAGWEGVVAAAMGQFTDMGLNRVLMGIEASYSPLTLASAYGSVFGVLAITLALRARQRHGYGDRIEVPLAAALMEGLAYNSLRIDKLPDRYKTMRELEIERRRASRLPMDLSYAQLQPFLDPFYRTYMCRDGRPFYVVSEAHATHSERALKILGIWDELVADGLPTVDPYLSRRDWPPGVSCTIRAYPQTEPWAGRLSKRMTTEFLKKDAAEWERIFGEAGAPAAAHRTTREWLRSAHAKQASLVVEVEDPDFGWMLQPGPVAWLGSRGTQENALANATSTSTKLNPAEVGRPWLAGITIIDLTNVIAGPTIAGTLARFGARVIKIDPVKPTFDPYNTICCGIYGNQGKESALVDLKTEPGRQVLARLLKIADVVTINASEKQLGPLGLSYEQLKAQNPGIVLCHLDAFGGPSRGPRSDYPGYDDLVQASTGIMERFGGSFETVEEHAHFGTIDVLAGVAAAFAVALALLKREKTGEGDVARSSLVAAGQWLQARFMYDYDGRPPFDEPRGRQTKGEGPFYRCYRGSDRWFFLAGKVPSLSELSASPLFSAALRDGANSLEHRLQIAFAAHPAAFWRESLAQFGLTVQPLELLANVRHSAATARCPDSTVAFVRHEEHPSGHAVEHVLPRAIRPTHSRLTNLSVAEKYGQSTRRLIRELGFSDSECDDMIRSDAVSLSWCDQYLPD